MKIRIRKAKKEDSKQILDLIVKLAKFEKLTPPDKRSMDRMIIDAFSKSPLFKILVAETEGVLMGYAFYFFTYSTFLAKKTLYLEDIFITEKYRGTGIGKLFLDKLVRIAKNNKCGRMEWIVLDWNTKAINFYKNIGAEEMKEWKFFRLKI